MLSQLLRVDDDDNQALGAIPTIDEVKKVVFSMSSNSSPGPDGISGNLFHHCWDIIAEYLYNVILDFFSGSELPRSFTHTYLVLIPKIDNLQQYTEFRPISLSNFTFEIISKLLNTRLSP